MNIKATLFGLIAAATLAGACGADPNDTNAFVSLDADDGVRQIEVHMSEFAFDYSQMSVVPGEDVKFIVINDGLVRDQFELSNHAAVNEHLEGGHTDHEAEEQNGHEEDHATETAPTMVDVAPGETKILEVTFPDDSAEFTEFVCLIPGHYEAGMHSEIDYTG